MADKMYDAIVIGGGPGGYVAGIRLGQLGIRTAVIEREHFGGACLNWGCIPSKALIHAAHTFHQAQHASDMGITVSGVAVDGVKLQEWKNGIVSKMTGGVRQLLKGNKVDAIDGVATFTGPRTVRVEKGSESLEVGFQHAIVATGGSPIHIPGFEVDERTIVTAKGALALTEIPKRVLIVGGGVIGLELGGVFQNFGSELTVLEALPDVLTGVDPDLARMVKRRMTRAGAKIHTGATARSAKRSGDVVEVTHETGDGSTESAEVDVVLVAVGFRPNTGTLGLDVAGVPVGDRGFLSVDNQMRTGAGHIFAIGDITGPPFLAHRASKQGEIAAEVIAGHPAEWDVAAVPSAIFTDPEIATVGLTEAEAKAQRIDYKVGKFNFAANGRAMSLGSSDGFVKVLIDPETKLLLGAGMVGPQVSDLVSELALALEMGALAPDIGLTVHPHPTLPEVINEAVRAAYGEAIHAINR